MPSLQGQKARKPFPELRNRWAHNPESHVPARRFLVPNLYVEMYVIQWLFFGGKGKFYRNEWLWLKQEFAMSNELNSFSRKFERSSSFLSGMKFYVFLCEIGWSSEESFGACKDGRSMSTKHAEQIEVS